MKQVKLRNGISVSIREAAREDAEQMIDFYNEVGGETDFLSFGKNEFQRNVMEYEGFLDAARAEQNSIILLAFINDEMVSIASINSSQKPRSKHVGTLGIVISKTYTGIGLGRILMESLIDWAKQNGVTRKISLVTREDNDHAIHLYRKLGFEEEGLIKEENYIKGSYYNTLVMALFI
ncbi:hypothetical protein BACCIP111895_00837 [Neobacillus rhizosphaerae]|uniref:N-acetyltransferase domain-containing protein n=1 Tax=Neobacillus rhizosphaerae TaxID=2880965 RepID=A0ABM9EM70_9BACI|nr:GNAT family N-acetyltransferase [Neobacillus rhizosphaerae]CAH2713683.1 hypothetical protein BACCIP111895_00837 [Neobacillus rhizosphaerae]